MKNLEVFDIEDIKGQRIEVEKVEIYIIEGDIGMNVLKGKKEKGIGIEYMVGKKGGYII